MSHVHDNFNSIYKCKQTHALNWKTFIFIVWLSLFLPLSMSIYFSRSIAAETWSQWRKENSSFFLWPYFDAAPWPIFFRWAFAWLHVTWREKRSLAFRNVIPFGLESRRFMHVNVCNVAGNEDICCWECGPMHPIVLTISRTDIVLWRLTIIIELQRFISRPTNADAECERKKNRGGKCEAMWMWHKK